jgi:hypothetical protein
MRHFSRFRLILCLCFLATSPFAARAGGPYDVVRIDTVKTSIYVGNVTLTTTLLKRSEGVYSTEYKAKVFPYFFYNESGHLWIDFSDEQLAQLARGETVQFKGRAENSDHETRRVEGRAVPTDGTQGKLKVRVFVSPKIELIFNTIYHFEKP